MAYRNRVKLPLGAPSRVFLRKAVSRTEGDECVCVCGFFACRKEIYSFLLLFDDEAHIEKKDENLGKLEMCAEFG